MGYHDRRDTLLHSYENAAVIVSAMEDRQLAHPTPCPGYDVAGLIDHLVEAAQRAAALGQGQAPPPGDHSPHVELADAPSAASQGGQRGGSGLGRRGGVVVEAHHALGRRVRRRHPHRHVRRRAGWPLLGDGVRDRAARKARSLTRAPSTRGSSGDDQTSLQRHGGTGSPLRSKGLATSGADECERLAAFMGRDPRAKPSRNEARPR